MKKLFLSGLFVVFSLTCVRSVHSENISYNFYSLGGSFADRQSDFVSDDLDVDFDMVVSRHLFTFSSADYDLGIHSWYELSFSKNISNDYAYKLTLLQNSIGIGVDYTSDVFSTYIGVGLGQSLANFEPRAETPPDPKLPPSGKDIFAPPPDFFDFFPSNATNDENGSLVQLGIRYRVSKGYEIGALIRHTNLDSIGTEFSAFVQRDIGVQILEIGIEDMSLRLTTTLSDVLRSIGLSLVMWY